jgi:hypothetical protein
VFCLARWLLGDKMKIVFYTSTNSPNKKDSTGAFIPEAKKFADYHGDVILVPVKCRGNTRDQRAQVVYNELDKHDKIDTVVFLCHGHPTHIQHGFGIRGKNNNERFAKILSSKNVERIIFYCCSVARNNPKISQMSYCGDLHNELYLLGNNAEIYGHTTAGHTTRNPFVKVFVNGDVEGKFIVDPCTKDWEKWRTKLRRNSTYRFKFPFDVEICIDGK